VCNRRPVAEIMRLNNPNPNPNDSNCKKTLRLAKDKDRWSQAVP